MAKTIFDDLNGKKLVIGLVHLLPMPATPLYEEGNIEKMMEKAIKDCKTLQNARRRRPYPVCGRVLSHH